MKFLRKCSGVLSPILIALMIYTVVPVIPAFAGIVTTDQLIDLQAAAADRDKVSGFLAREDVRRQMQELGVDPQNVDQRVAALSDNEVRALAERIDQMPAGQGVVGVIILVAVVLFVVFVITDMIGVTDVFPFINAQTERRP
jgi:hypothetical protein